MQSAVLSSPPAVSDADLEAKKRFVDVLIDRSPPGLVDKIDAPRRGPRELQIRAEFV